LSEHIQQPLISIVIPVYDRWELLKQAVASVVAQTYTNWELIVVDDGSTDGTREKLALLNNKKVNVFTIPHCGNVALLRNTGTNISSGEWIAFLDSDDLWVPEKLELQLKALQERSLWSYSGSELMNEHGLTIPFNTGNPVPISGWIIKELLTNKASAAIGTLMVHHKLFDKLGGFNTALGAREDYEFVLRLAIEAEALAVPNVLTRIREHKDRRTNDFTDPHELTAAVYKHFIANCKDDQLRKVAQRRLAYNLAEAAKNNINKKKYGKAARQLGNALISGDRLRHILSVFR
jgi:glycosyltransferase involved in cell wall biosynthesis